MITTTESTPLPRVLTHDRVARTLLWLSALAATSAAADALPQALGAAADVRFVELWRAIGFATFAGLFAVLAIHLRRVPLGVWVVLIANKLVLTTAGLAWASSTPGAGAAAAWDGALTVLLCTALLLTRWSR